MIPARYALERADWAGAAALPVASTGRAMADSLVPVRPRPRHGAQRRRRRRQRASRRCSELRNALEKSSQSLLGRSHRGADPRRRGVGGVRGGRAQAGRRKLMRAAADGEDGSVKHVAMENRLYPMRDLLGELLLQIRQPAAALASWRPRSRRTRTARLQ